MTFWNIGLNDGYVAREDNLRMIMKLPVISKKGLSWPRLFFDTPFIWNK